MADTKHLNTALNAARLCLLLICASILSACSNHHRPSTPATTPMASATTDLAAAPRHPRLWITATDLPRLRSWARATNPIWTAGPEQLGKDALQSAQTLSPPADGCVDSGGTPCEAYAELFAFLSLTSPSPSDRQNFAMRAHDLVMSVISEAAKGDDPSSPLRSPSFPLDDRSRYYGEGLPLAVDWIYPTLSTAEKKTIRDVFAHWSDEIEVAAVTTDNHPQPLGVKNDPALTSDPVRVRWAGNNYYGAHLRNLGLMALALDPADDSDGKLHAHLASDLGAWLYVTRALYTGDARGGLFVEGFEYGPQTLSYAAQLLWALETAGELDPQWGPGVTLARDRFWDDLLVAYPSALSPTTVSVDFRGALYEPAWFGDGQHFLASDMIDVVAPVGILGKALGKPSRLDGARFIAREFGPGGPSQIGVRARDTIYFRRGLLYFLLFDPDAPAPPDLRASLPLQWLDAGEGRLYARTSWQPHASWLSFGTGWITIDHQTADGLDFGFYRQGEFLTKRRSGYGSDVGVSDNFNTLALENSQPAHVGDYRGNIWRHGSQWVYTAAGDGRIVTHSSGPGWVYALGDATPLYNSTYEGSTDVAYASRSLVWLEPDFVVVYDRAATKPGRFKRFWLQLAQTPRIVGNRAIATTPGGQQLFVTRLLPVGAVLSTDTGDPAANAELAELEPMHVRLCDTAPSQPAEARWLHVLQGADAGSVPDEPLLVSGRAVAGGGFDGVVVHNAAVLFPQSPYGRFDSLSYTVPLSTQRHLLVGLSPNANFTVQLTRNPSAIDVVVTHGGSHRSDAGGVLAF